MIRPGALRGRPGPVGAVVQAAVRRYAEAQAAVLAPFVVGPRVLDLGAGEGYVAGALRRRGLTTCAVDVGDFRRAPAPYVVYDGRRLPLADRAVDTTLILLALHHCAEPEAVLDEAVRVTRARLLVTESVTRNRLDRLWLDLLDGRVNRLRHRGLMPPALGFRSPDGWRGLFEARGLTVVATRWLGSRWERLVHHPLLYVLDAGQPATGGRPGR